MMHWFLHLLLFGSFFYTTEWDIPFALPACAYIEPPGDLDIKEKGEGLQGGEAELNRIEEVCYTCIRLV
jgi:hypothetical protein